MGKSVYLRQLREVLSHEPNLDVVLLSEPPKLTASALLEALALALEVEIEPPLSERRVIEARLQKNGGRRLTLLYDEMDRYARPPAGGPMPGHADTSPGRDFFDNLESVRRDKAELGVMAAGSLGVFVFRDIFGSSFLARAESIRIPPFTPEQVSSAVMSAGSIVRSSRCVTRSWPTASSLSPRLARVSLDREQAGL